MFNFLPAAGVTPRSLPLRCLHTLTHACTRLYLLVHAYTRLHTLTHDYTRLYSLAHAYTRLHTLARTCTRQHTLVHSCACLHTLTHAWTRLHRRHSWKEDGGGSEAAQAYGWRRRPRRVYSGAGSTFLLQLWLDQFEFGLWSVRSGSVCVGGWVGAGIGGE
jgi:hypothetical protein